MRTLHFLLWMAVASATPVRAESLTCGVDSVLPASPANSVPTVYIDGSTSASRLRAGWVRSVCDHYANKVEWVLFGQHHGQQTLKLAPWPDACGAGVADRPDVGDYTPLVELIAYLDTKTNEAAPALVITDGIDCPAPHVDGRKRSCQRAVSPSSRVLLFGERPIPGVCDPDATGALPLGCAPIRSIGHLPKTTSDHVTAFAASTRRTAIPMDPRAVVVVENANGTACTGTMISDAAVLTAAHCLPSTSVAAADTRQSAQALLVSVVDAASHPAGLDVALLRLERPIAHVPVFRRNHMDHLAPTGRVQAVGFGARARDGASQHGTRQIVDLVVQGWGCDGGRPDTFGCTPGAELLVPPQGGADTCSGDSGGPVFEAVPDPRSKTARCALRLLAVTSRSLRGRGCGQGGIYTRVDAIDNWIHLTLADWSAS